MGALKSILIAFAMFSRLPMPRLDWSAANMRYVMAAFPLVGAMVGASVIFWNWFAAVLLFGPFLRGAGFALLPTLLTGGIHLDGFCDTVDALASHGDAAKKHAILKDPHLGAFAAMAVAGYLLLFAALASELPPDSAASACFALVFILSRALAGMALVLLPAARDSGLGRIFRDASARRTTLALLAISAAGAGGVLIWLGGWPGILAAAAALACLAAYRRMALREFGGVTGDLSGWFVQVCELAALAALVIGQKVL